MTTALTALTVDAWSRELGLAAGARPVRFRGDDGLHRLGNLVGISATAAGSGGDWEAAVHCRRLSTIDVACVLHTPTVLRRRGDNDAVIVTVTSPVPYRAGRLALLPAASPLALIGPAVACTAVLQIPVDSLGSGFALRGFDAGAGLGDSPLSRTAEGAVRSFVGSVLAAEAGTPTLAAESALVDLLDATVADATARRIAASSNAVDVQRATGALIDRFYRDPALSPTVLAERLHLSRRQFYRHFENSDVGVAEMIADRRLRAARALLLANPEESIATVAKACGFGSTGPFRLRFQRAFGIGPMEFREQAAAASPGMVDVVDVGA